MLWNFPSNRISVNDFDFPNERSSLNNFKMVAGDNLKYSHEIRTGESSTVTKILTITNCYPS